MATVCTEPGCPNLKPCARHPDHRPGRGSTRAWRKLRTRILRRDNHTCFYCAAEANTVDHRIPVARGGTDDDSNLVAACASCNGTKGTR
jgi:5-methylcytosine-specific restriction endonuclease McrA